MRGYFEKIKIADEFFAKKWFVLPVVSAVLLLLSFYPFNLWFLNLVALAPFFYFINLPVSRRRLAYGGFLFGFVFSFSISYFTVIQFHWIPETYLFKNLVNLSFLLLSAIGGTVGCMVALSYRFFSGKNLARNAFVFGAIFAISELFLNFIFGGYFPGMLPLTADTLWPIMKLASVGGVFFVSFLMYSINAFAGQLLLIRDADKIKNFAKGLAVSLVLLSIIFAGNEAYLGFGKTGTAETIKVAILQNMDKGEGVFATTTDEIFKFNKLDELLKKASLQKPDLIIYPFSPVIGAIYFTPPIAEFNKKVLAVSAGEFARWLNERVPEGTIVMTWDVVYKNGEFLNQNDFWQNGRIVGSYRKRNLFPFADYTPKWAQKMSFYTTPYDIVKGEENQNISLGNGLSTGNLICSEISNQALASRDTQNSQIIISAGSEAMFSDAVASAFNLMHARYRAAENNVPVIRANRFGPSAIVDSGGGIVKKMKRGEDGVMVGEIKITDGRRTLFNVFGNVIVLVLIVIILLTAFYLKKRE